MILFGVENGVKHVERHKTFMNWKPPSGSSSKWKPHPGASDMPFMDDIPEEKPPRHSLSKVSVSYCGRQGGSWTFETDDASKESNVCERCLDIIEKEEKEKSGTRKVLKK